MISGTVVELCAKVASHESMLDHQTNELNQSIERTATAMAEVARLRTALDALKAGKRVVNMSELEELAIREFWRCTNTPSASVAAATRAVLAHLSLTSPEAAP